MDIAEFAEVLKGRRSIRAWQDKPVAEELLVQAVELATWAPNGANQQNWYFYIILSKDVIKSIDEAMQEGRNYMSSWPEMKELGGFPPPRPSTPGASPPPMQRRYPFSAAPAVIAVGTRKMENPLDKIMASREKVDESAAQMRQWSITIDSRIQSVSAAITYLLLVLHQMGLGAVWMTGPLPQCKGDVEKILNVPPDMDIITLIPIGYPADSPTGQRRPVSEVSEVIK